MEKVLSQAEEIAAICQRMNITRDELADEVPINRETLRKVANGYQPASERVMSQIRKVEQMAKMIQDKSGGFAASSLSPFRLMELETLQKHFIDLGFKLRAAAVHDRKYILGNLRAMLDELDERELNPPNTLGATTGEDGGESHNVREAMERGKMEALKALEEKNPKYQKSGKAALPTDKIEQPKSGVPQH